MQAANQLDFCSSLKKQQDSRMRQLDRLEVAVKNAVDSQKQWKQRVLLKHNEVESVKVSNDTSMSWLRAIFYANRA